MIKEQSLRSAYTVHARDEHAVAGHYYLLIYHFKLSGSRYNERSTVGIRLGTRLTFSSMPTDDRRSGQKKRQINPWAMIDRKHAISSPRSCTVSWPGCITNSPDCLSKGEISARTTFARFFHTTCDSGSK